MWVFRLGTSAGGRGATRRGITFLDGRLATEMESARDGAPLRGHRRPTSFRFVHKNSCKTRDLSDGTVSAGRHLTGRGLPSLLNFHYLCIYLYCRTFTTWLSINMYKYFWEESNRAVAVGSLRGIESAERWDEIG